MTDDALELAFCAHLDGSGKFTRRMAITIALMFGESPRAVIKRLEHIELLRAGSWTWFVDNGGITQSQIDQVRSDLKIGEVA